MSKPLTIAIVGLGGMGHEHARQIAKVSELRLLGSFDIRPERQRLVETLGGKAWPSLVDLLADQSVDAVLIATPNDSHKAIAIAALGAGKHVICEKPVALNSGELTEILAAAEAAGRVFMVHQNRRWDADYLTVKKILEQGSLGKLFHLESRILGSRGIPGDWRKKASQGGGMLLDWGVHLLDRLVFLVPGPIRQVYCKLNFPSGQEVDEGFHLFLTFEGGETALVEVQTRHFQPLPLWLVLGTEGTARIDNWNLEGGITGMDRAVAEVDAVPIQAGAGLTKTMAPRSEASEVHLPLPGVHADVLEFYRNFAAAAQGQAEPIIRNSEVLRIMRLMEAAFESHRTGQVVNFEIE